MIDAIQDLLDTISATASSMGQNSGLLQDLNGWNSSLANFSNAIATNIVLPIALVVLALFWILEFYNAFIRSSAGGGGSSTFMLLNLFQSFIKMALCLWAVQNSTIILNALFSISAQITSGIAGVVGSGQVSSDIDSSTLSELEGHFFQQLGVNLTLQAVNLIIKGISIIVNTLVAARFIELYVYNAFAAIPITTLCYQELHNVGIGFLKSYAGVAIQGSILYLVIGFYPALAASIGGGTGDILDQSWALLGNSVILLVAMIMSSRFAKAITSSV
ncbi:MAG: hypothetical protein DBX91_13655 [Subdoligranulum variabile]|uniref:VirB6/TrbL-like conjugal transfer protein, CD1112 family n=1 Tax=uncultured Subdoligranulum sp. TaxID=512298 RepID=UPI000D7A9ED0|nr:CD0415/CD1112 family protein [uncultured Subdoligranulum sp.]PWM56499.1 MAG: hypothetical protein DBX91_13655 [Subdoligranulum variabile]